MRRLGTGAAAAAVVLAGVAPAATATATATTTAVATAEAAPGSVVRSPAGADLAYHGHVVMRAGALGVRLTPQNHGPSDVPDATVRLRLSTGLADRQRLPEACLRSGAREVVCRTGRLRAGGWGAELPVDLRLRGRPTEATVRIDTAWNGAASDRNARNHEHTVLALDTGDSYFF